MSISASLEFRPLNRREIMDRITSEQMAALVTMEPVISGIITETIGTQYYTLEDLRKMKYPYRVGGQPPMPPGVINMQTGRFFKATRITGPTRIGDLVILQVINMDEDRARQLAGTESEIARPYKVLLQDRFRRQGVRQLTQALLKVKVAA
jgi:hypothetical protein